MQTRVAVLFGGQSVEHEVSIISGLQAFAALDRSRYVPIPLYITKDNRFYTGPHMGDVASYRDMPACLATATRVLPVPAEKGRVELVRYPFKKFGNNVVDSFDVALPVVHGTNTEDGTLMGFLEMLGVPYDFIAENLLRSARKFTGRQLEEAVRLCAQADFAMKSSGADDMALLKELLLRIAVGGAA